MDLVWLYLVLRAIARSLRAGDLRSAGEQLDSDLDGVTDWLGALFTGACGCYAAWLLMCLVGGVVYAVCDVVGYLLRGR